MTFCHLVTQFCNCMLFEWQVLDNNNGEMMSKMSESDDVTVNSDRRTGQDLEADVISTLDSVWSWK